MITRNLFRSVFLLAVGAGLAVAWMAIAPGQRDGSATAGVSASTPQVWTCSMHPQIRMDHKDVCPLCGMDLTLVRSNGGGGGGGPADPLSLSPYAQMMARMATTPVRSRELFKDIRTVGRVELDETRVAHIASRVEGRVDQVFADFPGTIVKKGEHLVSIYSPQLVTTQEEYLIALRAEQERQKLGGRDLSPSLSSSALRRLELWGLSKQQLDELAQRGTAETHLIVYAPLGGTVIEKNIRPGQYVKEGDSLYTIADLEQVWLVLEIYEFDLSWIRQGQPVRVTLESEPGQAVIGQVAFIEPLLNQATRTVRVRVVLENTAGIFKPGMYAQASLRIPIMPDGGPAPSVLQGKYVCPMHPYDFSDEPGDCKLCGMPRELFPARQQAPSAVSKPTPSGLAMAADARPSSVAHAPATPPKPLAVPAEAVLTTGQRQLVYVERKPGEYHLVQPQLGPRAGDFYPVLAGLAEGDRVVVRGNFLLDSQFQISGKPSLLNPPEDRESAALDQLSPEDRQLALAQKVCPVTGAKLGSMGTPYKVTLGNRAVFLCCKGCEGAVKKDPDGILKKLDEVKE
jgi:membrane fusion protein, copper/silver efflux system